MKNRKKEIGEQCFMLALKQSELEVSIGMMGDLLLSNEVGIIKDYINICNFIITLFDVDKLKT